MELLELLETKIDALLAEVEKLRKENSSLQEDLLLHMQNLDDANQQINTLKAELDKAHLVRERLEVLKQKIENVLTD